MQLNGCVIEYSYDKLSKKCRACMNNDYCDQKSKEKYGVLSSPNFLMPPMESGDLTKIGNAIAATGVSFEKATEALIHATTCINKYRGDSV